MKKEKYIKIGNSIKNLLIQIDFVCLLEESFFRKKNICFDLSINNKVLLDIKNRTPNFLSEYIKQTFSETGAFWGSGGYGEKRNIYQASLNFQNNEKVRDIHLGLDIWMPAGVEIFAPIGGVIHSFKDNNQSFDYGPTIIIEHKINDIIFYTLYGHLSRMSLLGLRKGLKIVAGQRIARVGEETENGCWPTHLHFQIIGDLMGMNGDFPGVSSKEDSEMYLNLCPDPKLLFKILDK